MVFDVLDGILFLYCGVLGLLFGSFASAIAYREAQGESWFQLKVQNAEAWSRCPDCKTRLTAKDLVPVLSWIWNRGKCRHCGKLVSVRYPILEITSLCACAGIFFAYGMQVQTILLLLLVPFFLALIMVDFQTFLLPNRLILICTIIAALRVMLLFVQGGNEWAILVNYGCAAVLLSGLLWLTGTLMTVLLKKQALGLGDVKLMIPIGLLIGFDAIPFYLIASGALGVLFGLAFQFFLKEKKFPYGPALITALYIILNVNSPYFSGG